MSKKEKDFAYYTVSETAELIRVSNKTVIRLIKAGKLKALNVSVGKRFIYRIPREEIELFTEVCV